MKLSEAIRLGAMIRPQAFDRLLEYDGEGKMQASCAIGAASEAVGARTFLDLYTAFPILQIRVAGPIDFGCDYDIPTTVGQSVACLNDHNRWTREQIADWVETVERDLEAAEAQTEEMAVSV